ncbi:ribbon-helix-helix domain-containing protein [Henriciella sp.]|uniref:ribbon-helix-helix domain-containing protein n=1 Tax=Henriciella sp. TaxID=1968823 RepID=UPI000C10818B|nr:ribbon-helix-helix domain-containing protein [Henriciella sp.]PHR68788.1 MAG: hypothetical protein COA64_16810 [Henriciella sp.]
MSKRLSIADAMREAGGSTRATTVPTAVNTAVAPQAEPQPQPKATAKQPSRAGTKAITGHYPPQVRYQLKLLAAEQGRTMEDMLAEGLNRLFAAYNKPEIAPASRGDA